MGVWRRGDPPRSLAERNGPGFVQLFAEEGDLFPDAEWRECDASARPPLGRLPVFPVGRFRVEARGAERLALAWVFGTGVASLGILLLRALAVPLPLLFAGAVAVLAMMSGRLYLAIFFGSLAVGSYESSPAHSSPYPRQPLRLAALLNSRSIRLESRRAG